MAFILKNDHPDFKCSKSRAADTVNLVFGSVVAAEFYLEQYMKEQVDDNAVQFMDVF